jgi:hypothetical protein
MVSANTNKRNNDGPYPYPSPYPQQPSPLVKSFIARAQQFMKDTEQHALQGVNPGGYIRPYGAEMRLSY